MPGLRHPQVHPDGRRVVFGTAEISREVWAIENAAAPAR